MYYYFIFSSQSTKILDLLKLFLFIFRVRDLDKAKILDQILLTQPLRLCGSNLRFAIREKETRLTIFIIISLSLKFYVTQLFHLKIVFENIKNTHFSGSKSSDRPRLIQGKNPRHYFLHTQPLSISPASRGFGVRAMQWKSVNEG